MAANIFLFTCRPLHGYYLQVFASLRLPQTVKTAFVPGFLQSGRYVIPRLVLTRRKQITL